MRLIHRLLAAITTTNLLLYKDIVDDIGNIDFVGDGGGDNSEVIDEFLKIFPCLAFREDGMQGPEVVPK